VHSVFDALLHICSQKKQILADIPYDAVRLCWGSLQLRRSGNDNFCPLDKKLIIYLFQPAHSIMMDSKTRLNSRVFCMKATKLFII